MRELFTAADMATIAIDNLIGLLEEAREYLADRQDLAAFGTLIQFDDAGEDMKAAIRLLRSAVRRKP
ncbi:MAG: hypothetical protein ACRD9W_12920 [Terriglobia bacterium]